jgi:hypothetical protein
MTVAELVKVLMYHDQNKRVVVADRDGAGKAEDIENVDQRVEKGEAVITLWYHK